MVASLRRVFYRYGSGCFVILISKLEFERKYMFYIEMRILVTCIKDLVFSSIYYIKIIVLSSFCLQMFYKKDALKMLESFQESFRTTNID